MSIKNGIFKETISAGNYKLMFSSTMANIDKTCLQVSRFLKSENIHIEPHLFAINLVLREGLTNAVRHGNQKDFRKQVRLTLDVSVPDLLSITIEDQGNGFNWQEAFETEPLEDLDHGRGILIMKRYFTKCAYNEKGNILFLEKRLS